MATRAIIIGGGIGGITAAHALLRAGLEVVVCEQTTQLREVGAGLTVWPNAMKALRALDLDEPVLSIGRSFGVGQIYDRRGRILVAGARREELEKRFGWPGIVLHRHQLLGVLASRLPAGVVRLGKRCTAIRQHANGVRVAFADGEEMGADLLVGADGLNSLVRATLLGQRRPCYAGYTAYRGINCYPLDSDIAYETWGVGQRFGFVPGPGGEIYWWAALTVPAGLDPPASEYKHDLLKRYHGWFEPIPAMIAATPEGTILRNDVFDRPPAPRLSVGRVTLLGDAAHPITPDLGQGACLALEDAVILGQCLERERDTVAALEMYQRRRRGRAAFLARHSRGMGMLGQLAYPELAGLRNRLVGLTPAWASMLWLSMQFRFEV